MIRAILFSEEEKLSEYYLLPGTSIGKKGLPGGQISAKDKPVQVSDEHAEIIGPSLDFLVSQGKVSKGFPAAYAEPYAPADDGKSAKRLELEAQATELGIEFTDKTTQKELAALIEKALA
jgi:hypothetical protein